MTFECSILKHDSLSLCRITLSFLLFTLLSYSATAQSVWYVNDNTTNGDEFTTSIGALGNPGTASAPFATIAAAISAAVAGDTVYVDAGMCTLSALVSINKSLKVYGANWNISTNNELEQDGKIGESGLR